MAIGEAKDARHESGIAFVLEKLKKNKQIPLYSLQSKLKDSTNILIEQARKNHGILHIPLRSLQASELRVVLEHSYRR